jgi:glucose-1-phosphate cytidylyltransferase
LSRPAHSNIGQRLRAVDCRDEPEFLANYSDGSATCRCRQRLETPATGHAVAGFVSVKPNLSYHVVSAEPGDWWRPSMKFNERRWINGGFFMLRQEIFNTSGSARLVCSRSSGW